MSDLNKVSLIDTSEEEQASLVQAIPASKAPAQKEHDNLLDSNDDDAQPHTNASATIASEIDQQQDEAVIMATTAKEEDWEGDKKEHPLASLSLEEYENNDPWAAQPEDNALLQADVDEEDQDNAEATLVQQPVATTTVFDADNRHEPVIEEQLDEDTSATKVNSSYSLINLKLCLSTCFIT